ncbi:hypothetical protein WN55_03145 [Dufourea novaeangliae]|uniref:Uncharacterized protein n=1 Tax=Dufourea novaeangliae TaxID=178035 RepID=A0A154PKR4_DUFNO|nr:hypothetical protein WN55_03145 [Dufourea novaeangliae]
MQEDDRSKYEISKYVKKGRGELCVGAETSKGMLLVRLKSVDADKRIKRVRGAEMEDEVEKGRLSTAVKMKRLRKGEEKEGWWGGQEWEEKCMDKKRRNEWRFRRVIGSAGVDAILSSIPHQPSQATCIFSLTSYLPITATVRRLHPSELVPRSQGMASRKISRKEIGPRSGTREVEIIRGDESNQTIPSHKNEVLRKLTSIELLERQKGERRLRLVRNAAYKTSEELLSGYTKDDVLQVSMVDATLWEN